MSVMSSSASSGSGGGYREEVFNVVLAQLLSEYGLTSAPEQSVLQGGRRASPDVIIEFRGLRTAIEGKVDDQPGAEAVVTANATRRLEQGLAHIAVAAIYPARLRVVPFHTLRDQLRVEQLKLAVFSEAGQQGWTVGDVSYLGSMLRRTFVELVQENTLSSLVDVLREAVGRFSDAVNTLPGASERLVDLLGIGEPNQEAEEDT